MAIKYVRFTSGEEVIADVIEKDDEILLKEPLGIFRRESASGDVYTVLKRLTNFMKADEPMVVRKSDVFVQTGVPSIVELYYVKSLAYQSVSSDVEFVKNLSWAIHDMNMDVTSDIVPVLSEIMKTRNEDEVKDFVYRLGLSDLAARSIASH